MGDYQDACVRLDRPRSGERAFSSHELTSSSAALGLSGQNAELAWYWLGRSSSETYRWWELAHGTSLSPIPPISSNLKIPDATVFVPFTPRPRYTADEHQQTVSSQW